MMERRKHLVVSMVVFTLFLLLCFVADGRPHGAWWWILAGISSTLLGALLGVFYHLVIYYGPYSDDPSDTDP